MAVERLKEHLKARGLKASLVEVGKASTVEEAARELGCSRREIVKSIVLVTERGEPVIGIVDGSSSVDLKRVGRLVGASVRVANREEALRLTGFPAGGIPPVCHGCKAYIDERVLTREEVYGGGGDEKHLLRISPREIVRDGAQVARIRK